MGTRCPAWMGRWRLPVSMERGGDDGPREGRRTRLSFGLSLGDLLTRTRFFSSLCSQSATALLAPWTKRSHM